MELNCRDSETAHVTEVPERIVHIVQMKVKRHTRTSPVEYRKSPPVFEIKPDKNGNSLIVFRNQRAIIHVVGWQGNASKKKE